MKQPVFKTLLVLWLGIMPYFGYAEIPGTINYQGFLSDASGNPVDKPLNITFSIPGTTWSEFHSNVPVKKGVFNVLLGETMPFTGFVDFNQSHVLRIEVNGAVKEVEMSSVPYAFRAKSVAQTTLSNLPCSQQVSGVKWDGEQWRCVDWATLKGQLDDSHWKATDNGLYYTNGNVGIGALPQKGVKLVIQEKNKNRFMFMPSNGIGATGLEIRNSGEITSTIYAYVDFSNNIDADYDMRLALTGDDSFAILGGNVGIDKKNPQYKLDVNGIIRGNNVTPSDQSLKQNIQPLEHSLAKIIQLRGVSFEWKEKKPNAGTQIGLIAQEVEPVLPEVVSTDNEGLKSIAYGKLVAVLIESVKEQQQLIDQKSASIAAQQEKITLLETKMQKMEQQMAVMNQTMNALKATLPTQTQQQQMYTQPH